MQISSSYRGEKLCKECDNNSMRGLLYTTNRARGMRTLVGTHSIKIYFHTEHSTIVFMKGTVAWKNVFCSFDPIYVEVGFGWKLAKIGSIFVMSLGTLGEYGKIFLAFSPLTQNTFSPDKFKLFLRIGRWFCISQTTLTSLKSLA